MGNASGKPVVYTDEGNYNRPRVQDHESLLTGAQVKLEHFRLLRVVGKGAFGKVRIVERKDTGLTFALKYIRKDEGSTTGELHSLGSMADTEQWFDQRVCGT